jgi:hypothetical protein
MAGLMDWMGFDPTRMFGADGPAGKIAGLFGGGGSGQDPWNTTINTAGSPVTYGIDGKPMGFTKGAFGGVGDAVSKLGGAFGKSQMSGAEAAPPAAAPQVQPGPDPASLKQAFSAITLRKGQTPKIAGGDPTKLSWAPERIG